MHYLLAYKLFRNPSISRDSNVLPRSTSDPNLAHDVNDPSGSNMIPDYNAPPPYAINASLNPSTMKQISKVMMTFTSNAI